MQSFSLTNATGKFEEDVQKINAFQPSITFLFASPCALRDQKFVQVYKEQMKGTALIGCSTAGEIAVEGYCKDGYSFLAIKFDSTEVRTVKHKVVENDSFATGESLAELLKGPKLKAVIVYSPGLGANGSALIDGMVACLGHGIQISGGLAADGLDFKITSTLYNGEIATDHVVAVGFYGDSVVVSCGSEGGWRPFGQARRVTKAEGNILYELDQKPALQLYKQYLGDKARFLPASGMSYPFAILRGDRSTSGVIRSALNIDHEHESLILAGNIEQGCQVCLMHADTDALTQGAAQAAAEALRTHMGPEEGGCALLVSCVGRLVVLGIDVDDEIEAVKDSFLPGIPFAGYYAYGEICSYAGTGRIELHNQTMTITYITETQVV